MYPGWAVTLPYMVASGTQTTFHKWISYHASNEKATMLAMKKQENCKVMEWQTFCCSISWIWYLIHRYQYCRTGFDCEILLIVNCKFFHTAQSKQLQEKEYAMNNITCDLTPFAQTLNTCSHLHSTEQSRTTVDRWDEYSSIFQVKSKPANTQPSATVAKCP